jgi:selenocysteine lyase/cysteine desulfurase
MEESLLKHKDYKTQVISLSATSNVTSQKTAIDKINEIVKFHRKNNLNGSQKCYFILDGAAFCSHDRLDLSSNGY